MRLVYANIILSNPVRSELKPITTKCLIDAGSTYLCIPQHIATQLQIHVLETREATFADGSSQSVPYGGPLMVSVEKLIYGTCAARSRYSSLKYYFF